MQGSSHWPPTVLHLTGCAAYGLVPGDDHSPLHLDEHFYLLDAELRVCLREAFVRQIDEQGMRALLGTHYKSEARAMAHAVWREWGDSWVSLW